MTICRFAPSPTGFLHVGNLRTALLNYLVARKSGGEFILRIDDTDRERSREEYVDAIKQDLGWLGLQWDRFERQSDRLDRYEDAKERLRSAERLYECFESRSELDLKRKKQRRAGLPPVYDRSALRMSESERSVMRNSRPSHWRFLLDRERTSWNDGILGELSIDAASVSDPVLIRGDGQFLYTLASVCDDIDFGVTNVVRGADHVTNTATQIQIFSTLGGKVPEFAHHSLLTGSQGEALAKRAGSLSARDLRDAGIEPMALLSQLARLGTSRAVEIRESLDDLASEFDLSDFGTAPARFDERESTALTARHLATMPSESVLEDLLSIGVPQEMATEFWEAIRENVTSRADIRYWWNVCIRGAEPLIDPEDVEFVKEAMALLPPRPWDGDAWASWTRQVKEKTGRRGRSLFLPLRKALTGSPRGPEMAKLMPLMRRTGS